MWTEQPHTQAAALPWGPPATLRLASSHFHCPEAPALALGPLSLSLSVSDSVSLSALPPGLSLPCQSSRGCAESLLRGCADLGQQL